MKNIKLITYMLGYVWKADKSAFGWAAADFFWKIIPITYDALIYKFLIDAIMQKKPLSQVVLIAAFYALSELISRVFARYIYENRFERSQLRVQKYCNNLLLRKCAALDMECYDDAEFYDKLSKALGQANDGAMNVFHKIRNLAFILLRSIIGLSIISMVDPLMIVVALITGIVILRLNSTYFKTRFEANEEMVPVNRKVDYFHGLLRDRKTISDAKQYKGFDQFILGKYNKALDEKISLSMKLANKEAVYMGKTQIIVVIFMVLFPYVYLAIQSFRGIISVANLPAMFNAFFLLANGVADVSGNISQLKESCLYSAQLKEVIHYEPKIERGGGREIGRIEEIVFEKVSFQYPHSDNYVLKDLSITMKRGKKIAIVGINGAGKTTFVKLLMRYYDPCEGRILVNGMDMKEYDVNSLRDKMATLLQEFCPYNVPIDEMVACNEAPDDQKVERVLAEVGLADRLNAAPKKIRSEYSKMFEEDGVMLSGGELQKLFIARMRYKDSAIYIMDEPSSALDPIAEYEINNLMLNLAKDKTVVMIAHRLSTVVNADCILLIDGGRVLEMGSHKQLLAQNGKYARMFHMQAEQYQSA